MAKKEKIKIEKKKKRVPVPKKPPKIEEDKKSYNRKKEKEKLRKDIKKHSVTPFSHNHICGTSVFNPNFLEAANGTQEHYAVLELRFCNGNSNKILSRLNA